jgi:hypothetical protein
VALLKEKDKLGHRNTTLNLVIYFAICGMTLIWLATWRINLV